MASIHVVQKFFPNVKKVVDATRNARVEVTKKDTDSAAVKKHNNCAMAVACKRKFNLDGVIISRSVAYLIKGDKARRFLLPPSVEKEITSFDRGAGFAEGEYELSKPGKSQRLGVTHSKQNQTKMNRGEQTKFRHLTANVRQTLGGQKSA